MSFFRPSLNQHGLTEQQWRVIHILRQQGEMESYQLANQTCILRPSTIGMLTRPERDGIAWRWRASRDQRRVCVNLTGKDQQCFISMNGNMEENYQHIQERFGERKPMQLLELLNELKKVKP